MASTKTKIAVGALIALAVSAPLALRQGETPTQSSVAPLSPKIEATTPLASRGQGTATRPPAKSIFQRINESDSAMTMLPREEVEEFLARNRTNAESLLIAYRVTHDMEYLRKALAQYPTNASVLFRAAVHNATPENKRELLDQYKEADAKNALPAYLSAAERFEKGDLEGAYKELLEAAQRPEFRDDITEQILNLEEIYLAAGYSPAEAKALGMSAVEMPHVSQLVNLSKQMNELVTKYQQAGDQTSADRLAALGLDIARRLRSVQDGGNLLGEMVGLVVERNFLRQLDPSRNYSFVDGSVQERLNGFENREGQIRSDAQFMEKWLESADDSEIINYFDRLKMYGEVAAMDWLRQRTRTEQ